MNDIRIQTATLLGEIQTLAYMVNTFTEYCVFIDFSGHTNQLDIKVAANKKDYRNTLMEDRFIYMAPSTDHSEERALRRMQKIKTELRKILRKHQIDYSRLNYEIEEVRHYKFS